jgi:hypothetical protein
LLNPSADDSDDLKRLGATMVRRILTLGTVLAVAITAMAAGAPSGLYTGKTSQRLKITVKVSRGNVTKVFYTAKYGKCGTLSALDNVQIRLRHNKFNTTVRPNSETVDKVSGRFRGKNLSGTLSSSVRTGGIHPTTCRSGKLTFSARL